MNISPGLRSQSGLWKWSAIILGVLIALPLFVIAFYLFVPGSDVWQHIRDTVLVDYVINTVLLMTLTSVFAAIMGIGAAWMVSTREFRGRKLMEWLLVLPLAFPTYLMAFTQVNIFSYTGIFRAFTRKLGIADGLYFDLMHIPGLAFILALALYPYVYLPLRLTFRSRLSDMVEAARSLGASEIKIFFSILLPLSRPALAGGLFLVSMEVLNDYGAVKYFGINTLTTGIFSAWFSMGDIGSAIKIAAILLFAVFFLMFSERWQRKRKGYDNSNATYPLARVKGSSSGRWLTQFLLGALLIIALGLPLLQLVIDATKTASVVINDDFGKMIYRSVSMALGASLIVIAIAITLQYSLRLIPGKLLKAISIIANTGYAIPGAVIAVGVLLLTGYLDSAFGKLILTGSIVAMLYAYAVRFLAVGKSTIDSGFLQNVGETDRAARALGKSPLESLRKVVLPLLKRSILAAGILVFVDVLKELPLTLILRPFNFYTFATRTFEYAADEMLVKAALPALCIVFFGAIPILLLNRYLNDEVNAAKRRSSY